MSLSRLNIFLLVAVGSVFVLLSLLRVDNSRPNFEVHLGDDMAFSPAFKAYEQNANFTDDRTMQAPVAGTLARGEQTFHFEATPQDALRAGEQLANPITPDTEEAAEAAKRGQIVFQVFCTVCHGGDGAGNGPVAQRGFPPPPSLLTGKSQEMKDGQLFHILTLGQNSMPNFAAQLPPDRRWDVITYIRQLQQTAKPKTETKTEPTTEPTAAPAAETPPENKPKADEPEPDETGPAKPEPDESDPAEPELVESGEKS